MKRPLCLFITPLIGVVAACTGPIEPPDGLIDDSGSPTRPGAVPTTPGGTSSPPSMNPGANPGSNPGSGTGSTSGMFPGSGTGSTTGNPGSVTGTGGTGSGIPPATGGSPSTPVVPGDPTVPEDPNTPDPPNPATSNLELNGQPIYSQFIRLTHAQWEASVRDLLQLPTEPGLSSGFAGDPPEGTFSNNERALFVSSTLRTDYQLAAETLAEQVAEDAQALSRVTGGNDSGAFIKNFGRRVYRRPLTPDEEQRYQQLFELGAEVFASGNDFADGARLVIEAMLQSPNFIYRTELGSGGGRLTGYEMASKLSFLLRNTTPDDDLLDAAASGELDTPDGLLARAEQMLETTDAQLVMRRFHTELFGLDRYSSIDKDRNLFTSYSDEINDDLQEADALFFNHIFTQGQGLREILLSPVAFVNEATASFYGVQAQGSGFSQITLGPSRPGFFTRMGVLAYNPNLRAPHPIHRGVDSNFRVLCAHLTPPPGQIPALPAPMQGQTNRERVTAHTGPGTCGGACHAAIINPIGFAFENFDAIGQERSMDNGKPIDTTGEYEFSDGIKAFSGAPALLEMLAESPQAHACYSSKLAEYALSRDLVEADRPLVSQLEETSMAMNSIKEILLTIIQSPAFATRSGGAQ